MTKARSNFLAMVFLATAIAACAGISAKEETMPECGVVDGDGLFVFVGEKLEVTEVLPPGFEPLEQGNFIIRLDFEYRARYRIVDRICGDFAGDVIEFDAFDHWGVPAFANYETVLLYMSRYGDRYVHQKYQFNDVYKTRTGEWASCGNPYRREPAVHWGNMQAAALEFDEAPVFSVAGLTEKQIAEWFPPDYFSREGDRVTCKAGATADVLYTIKRLGVLKAREHLR